MFVRFKLSILGIAAAVTFVLVANASANRFSLSQQPVRITFHPITFNNNAGIGSPVRCEVTLEGSFHSRTITKVVGLLWGHISRAVIKSETCTGGSSTILRETLPWHVRYGGFSGVLPAISTVTLQVVGLAGRIQTAEIACLAMTTAARPTVAIAQIGTQFLRLDETRTIPLSGGAFCGFAEGSLAGEGFTSQLGNTAPILIKLI